MAKTKEKKVGLTPEEIKAFKAKYGKVFQISVEKDDETKALCYLKKPDRATIAAAMKYASSDPVKMNEILLNNCWIEGDDEIKTNDDLFMSASSKLSSLFNIKEAEVKEL